MNFIKLKFAKEASKKCYTISMNFLFKNIEDTKYYLNILEKIQLFIVILSL